MAVQWGMGALIGILEGTFAMFFAQGGWCKLKVCRRVWGRKGPWLKQRLLLLVIGLLIGIYGVWLYHEVDFNYLGYSLMTAFLLAAAVQDIHRCSISSDLLLTGVVLSVLYTFCWLDINVILINVVGGVIGGAVLGVPYLFRKGSVGLGDVLLLSVCGMFVGFPKIIYLLVRALVFMAILGLVKLIRKRATTASELPFAPFLLIATLI